MDGRILKEVDPDLLVCLMIYRGAPGGKPYSYNRLVRDLEGVVDRKGISAAIDHNFDYGIIDGYWERVDGLWMRCFRISEDAEWFVESVYRWSSLSNPELAIGDDSGTVR